MKQKSSKMLKLYLAIDCEWSEWVSGRCSETCGDGIQTNTRTKTVKEEHGGVCPGEATETNPCNQKDCPG